MELRILKLKQLQEAILKGDETTPSIYMFPELDPYVRTGGVCLRSGGCDGRPYNATIGFTRDLVLGGSTYLIDVYLETARRYLDTGDYSLKNPDYLLLSNIEPDIADGLETVDGLLVNLAGSTAASYQRGVHVLFSVTVAYYLAFCAYFFYRVARSIQAQISQMVNVTFWLSPEVVSECPKIQNFIATGAPAPRTEAALSAKKAA
ncbi:hypothetical protein DFJ77DRAFT_308283 [Powellomyces hirtus]|nr:hypothetical protein DFJ77DRAFT_308283 [Powellomyces hirtus]